jgi:hypothetical protein
VPTRTLPTAGVAFISDCPACSHNRIDCMQALHTPVLEYSTSAVLVLVLVLVLVQVQVRAQYNTFPLILLEYCMNDAANKLRRSGYPRVVSTVTLPHSQATSESQFVPCPTTNNSSRNHSEAIPRNTQPQSSSNRQSSGSNNTRRSTFSRNKHNRVSTIEGNEASHFSTAADDHSRQRGDDDG